MEKHLIELQDLTKEEQVLISEGGNIAKDVAFIVAFCVAWASRTYSADAEFKMQALGY